MDTEAEPPDSITEAVALLDQHQVSASAPDPIIEDGRLPHAALQVLTAAFQPRALGDQAVSDGHVADLRGVLGRRGDLGLDPIVVFWSGRAWYIVDGHHRLAAYRSSKGWEGRAVCVERFQGSPREAIAEALEQNSKTTMPLLRREKSEAAWQLVCLTDMRVAEVMAKADISNGSVKKMRSRIREVLAAYPNQYTRTGLADYQWRDVLKPDFGGPAVDQEIDEEWEIRMAREFRDRLRKEFGGKLTTCPDVFAMAIRLLHEGLPAMLMDSPEWQDQRNARLDAWTKERDDYDFS